MIKEISIHFMYNLCDFCGYHHTMEETSTYSKRMHIFNVYSMRLMTYGGNQHLFDTSMSEWFVFYVHNKHEIPGWQGKGLRVVCACGFLFSFSLILIAQHLDFIILRVRGSGQIGWVGGKEGTRGGGAGFRASNISLCPCYSYGFEDALIDWRNKKII